MKKILFSILSCTWLYLSSFGQTATEAFLFSTSDPTGTARNLGTGNSMFAIGPDFSVVAANPSGLAAYGKSEFLLTIGTGMHTSAGSFATDLGTYTKNSYANMILPNIGFIIHAKPYSGKWISSNWAIGVNRVAEFYKEINFAGRTAGSITDAWKENAEGIVPDDLNGFEEGLAYTSGAIYDFEDDNIYETDYLLNNQYALHKHEVAEMAGGKSEILLAYGADFDRKFYIGAAVGLPIVNYTRNRRYRESDESGDGIPFFNALEYTSSLNSTGFGLNGKIGVTFKPSNFLNIAFAAQSPTRLNLSDNFNTTLSYDFTDENHDGPIVSESPYGSFQYALITPWNVSGGIGIIAGRSGFLSVHAKYTDHGSMRFRYDVRGNGDRYEQIESRVNNDIRKNYGSALQFNAGGELVLADYYRVRGGVSMVQSAFNNDQGFDPSFHAGAGYRGENFYADLGYKLMKEEEGYLPYETTTAFQPLGRIDRTRHVVALTLGFKF